jgi:hypothetical protein
LFRYLTGEDLNSSPTQAASRYVINFFDWSEERAREYPDCFDIVERTIKPERAKVVDSAAQRWWQYLRPRPALYEAIHSLDRCIVIALVSKTIQPMVVPAQQVFAHKLAVFSTDSLDDFGVLTSAIHWHWAVKNSSTMRADLNYSPSDVFETLPLPGQSTHLAELARALGEERDRVMRRRSIGLTKTYNLVHSSGCDSDDIVALRHAHIDLDHAVREAYGWTDLALDHGFHPVANLVPTGSSETRGPEIRFTVSPDAQSELLDRLLELNHARHDEESSHLENQDLTKPGRRTARSTSRGEPRQGTLL